MFALSGSQGSGSKAIAKLAQLDSAVFDIVVRFPRVFGFGVTFPLHQILVIAEGGRRHGSYQSSVQNFSHQIFIFTQRIVVQTIPVVCWINK